MSKFFQHWIVKNLLLAILVVAVLTGGSAIALNIITRHGKTVTAPDLTNMTLAEAQQKAADNDVRVRVTDSVFVQRLGAGVVFRQNPKAGATVKKGRSIFVTINSIIPRKVVMPNLVGYYYSEAVAELRNRGLNIGKLRYVSDIATNYVLAQKLNGRDLNAGDLVVSGSEIELVLGIGGSDNRTPVPNLVGLKYIRAVEMLHSKCLNVGKATFDKNIRSYSDSVNAFVFKQETPSGTSKVLGSPVNIYLTLDESKIPAK